MNAYLAHIPGSEPLLVFAHTTKEAKRLCWQNRKGKFTDLRVQVAKKQPALFKRASAEKLLLDEAHLAVQ